MYKKHPLRRIVLGTAATVSGVVLLLALKQPGAVPGLATARMGSAPGAGAPAPAGRADGTTVTGDVAQTQYGPVQVRLTMGGGKVVKAEAIQVPYATARSKQVTADSIPRLNREAVTKHSARIDTVSGATYTSKGYSQSLQSALDKAKSAPAEAASSQAGPASEAVRGANATALPRPSGRAVTEHSARIDTVSSAAYSSSGYPHSLQSALDRAGL